KYPRTTLNSRFSGGVKAVCDQVTRGGTERMPELYPNIDGIFDLVQTGETLKQNGLVIVADNIQPVTFDGVWSWYKPGSKPVTM
ncbi:MAG TPA: hypothetical protein VFT58_05540, partial [Nitrososphaera sp.]|nr:hypothetical protein [Nitrososphaera sp.]